MIPPSFLIPTRRIMYERICAGKTVIGHLPSRSRQKLTIKPAKTRIYARGGLTQDIFWAEQTEGGAEFKLERRQRRGASGAPIVEKHTERGQGALLGLDSAP